MPSRGWVILGMLAFATPAPAQMVKEADLVGAWIAEVEHGDSAGRALGTRAPLALWPDGLWWYGGALHPHQHGGARWRLVGDTLWLANDYEPYFHPMIEPRIWALREKGYGLAVMDTAIINSRAPFPAPDSVYWSAVFRDTASTCSPRPGGCGTWVYKVSVRDRKLTMVRLDALSRHTQGVATTMVWTRDSLVNCQPVGGECN